MNRLGRRVALLDRVGVGVGVAVLLLSGAGSAGAQQSSPEQQRLDFLVGDWATVSETSDGVKISGTLSCHWVLGHQWLQVAFEGHPADGRVWEAHAMIKYDPERAEYVSYAFFNADDPVRYRGYPVDDTTLRFEHESTGGTFGIDYRRNPDGTVYQENWVMLVDGASRVTLKTSYSPAGDTP